MEQSLRHLRFVGIVAGGYTAFVVKIGRPVGWEARSLVGLLGLLAL